MNAGDRLQRTVARANQELLDRADDLNDQHCLQQMAQAVRDMTVLMSLPPVPGVAALQVAAAARAVDALTEGWQ